MIELTEFNYYFKQQACGDYEVYNIEDKNLIAVIESEHPYTIEYEDESYEGKDDEIIDELTKFSQRPEFMVGNLIELDGVAVEKAIEEFENLLDGTLRIRAWNAGKDPDKSLDYIVKVTHWIRNTTFYDDPASAQYHESFPHGLLYHTLRVYNKMCELIRIPTFKDVDVASATLCCLCHDWCKIGLYEQFKRNVKNEDGRWEQVDAYKRGRFPHPLGHGTASAFIAMKLFKLSEEEYTAIRWHMSMFNVSDNEINEYQQSCEEYPLVHLVQFADQLSITSY